MMSHLGKFLFATRSLSRLPSSKLLLVQTGGVDEDDSGSSSLLDHAWMVCRWSLWMDWDVSTTHQTEPWSVSTLPVLAGR